MSGLLVLDVSTEVDTDKSQSGRFQRLDSPEEGKRPLMNDHKRFKSEAEETRRRK